MKKYKLIKNFCDSGLKEGDILTFPENTNIAQYKIKTSSEESLEYLEFSLSEVSKYTENWEEVIEKDYEILSYKHQGSNYIWKKDSQLINTFCIVDGKGPFTTLKEINRYPKVYKIHSVKRLSDNEIFTVGEKVNFQGSGCSGEHSIKEFILEDDYIAVNGFVVEFPLKNIEKLPKVLFTTEDGVDIYKGDNYCKVNNHSDYSIFTGFTSYGFQDNYEGLKFSTERKAEEYVLMNKPCLSINEVIALQTFEDRELIKFLKNIVK